MVISKEEQERRTVEGRKKAESSRQKYFQRKKKALELEKKNNQQIYIVKSTGDMEWYKIFGRSAVFYRGEVYPEIKRWAKYSGLDRPAIHKDEDHDFVSEIGWISIRNVSKLKKILEDYGLKFISEKEGIITYRFKEPFTTEQICELHGEIEQGWKEINTIIHAEELMPALAQEIRLTMHKVTEIVRKMPEIYREMFGTEPIRVTVKLMQMHLAAERGFIPIEEYFSQAEMLMAELDGWMSLIFENRLIDWQVALAVAEKIQDMRMVVERTKKRKMSRGRSRQKK